MRHTTGPRAATIRTLLDGPVWSTTKLHRTTIVIMPELLDKAEQYKICAPKGRSGVRSIRVYFEDCLIRDIREYEKQKEDCRKKLESINQSVDNTG